MRKFIYFDGVNELKKLTHLKTEEQLNKYGFNIKDLDFGLVVKTLGDAEFYRKTIMGIFDAQFDYIINVYKKKYWVLVYKENPELENYNKEEN